MIPVSLIRSVSSSLAADPAPLRAVAGTGAESIPSLSALFLFKVGGGIAQRLERRVERWRRNGRHVSPQAHRVATGQGLARATPAVCGNVAGALP